MRHFCFLILAAWIILLFSSTTQAQNRRDFGIWSGLKINQKFTDNLSASLRGQVRLKEMQLILEIPLPTCPSIISFIKYLP